MRAHRVADRFATVALFIAAVALVLGLYKIALRTAPPGFRLNVPLAVSDADIGGPPRPGRPIYVRMNYCKTELVPSEVGVFLLSMDQKVMYPVLTMTSNLPVGCHVVDIVMIMPLLRRSGQYRLYMSRRYAHSLIEPSVYLLSSDPFFVQVP